MGSTKALGPNGILANGILAYFKPISLCDAHCRILNPFKLFFIVLIRKVHMHGSVYHFKPSSLCNASYKMIIQSNGLKLHRLNPRGIA